MLYYPELASVQRQTAVKFVLVVEDDALNAEFLSLALSSQTPYYVRLARHSFEALQAAEEIKPDLLLLDYSLPLLNGLELYDIIHRTPGLEDVPAILMSANTLAGVTREIEKRNLKLLGKPVDLDDLLASLKHVLN